MSIRHAILGFLSWKPFTGYELKKLFADSSSFYWSGNSNQIYGCLIQLHKEGAVTSEIQLQERYPARKVYAITESGREKLRAWLLAQPELPEIKDHFHIQLSWSEPLSQTEVDGLFAAYEALLGNQVLMSREAARRGNPKPGRSARESLIWKHIEDGRLASLESELAWARKLRSALAELKKGAGALTEGAGEGGR